MQDFEKLGQFYLGRQYDLATRQDKTDLVMYDAKDLTTHAVCVGMTGSGKTGLCLALLEEAGIDGIPAIAIDPKGDLGNLLLTFPELRPADFRPWIDESEAARKSITPDELAEQTATRWREGLAAWGQDGERIRMFREKVDIAIYTPGSSAGLPLSVLRSFAAPPKELVADGDLLRERVGAAVSGLLALVGIEADPIRSREHILLSQLLDRAWREGQNLDLAALVRGIQTPPFERVGSLDVESFFPAKDRGELAMRLNNLLASPGFAGWMQGEPLDIQSLLYTSSGQPRLSILSIAHLSDAERMFFVTILLNEVLAWIRTQSGTSSLRAILYMDEIFGYFPPTANPPSKTPMLTLLKQARAYGLGIVLATQNPVDLDYKGLSNTGTWFLGRLQTERDKARVLEGLEGASAAAGSQFNRGEMEATLAALGNRIFLMNNVHEDQPEVFETRWCMSYLRGPLSRVQIQQLMKGGEGPEVTTAAAVPAPATVTAHAMTSGEQPLVPPEIPQVFLERQPAASPTNRYQPGLWAAARVHFVDAKSGIDYWQNVELLSLPDSEPGDDPWAQADVLNAGEFSASDKPRAAMTFDPLPAGLARAKNYAGWNKALSGYLYRNHTLKVFSAPALKEFSKPEENEGAFRLRMNERAREARDEAIEGLRRKYAAKVTAAENQIQRAMERVAREKAEFTSQATQTAVSFGSTILKAIFGRKLASSTNVTSAASAAKSASRAARQREDIERAQKNLEAAQVKYADLEHEIEQETQAIQAAYGDLTIEPCFVRPRKSDIAVEKVALVWLAL